jgi:putative sterol carrier protein
VPYTFLSDDWVAEVHRLRADHDASGIPGQQVRANLVVTNVPFGEGTQRIYLDVDGGHVQIEQGEIDGADVTATLDYDTARTIIVEGNAQAAMQAFMTGRIALKGDTAKLLTLVMAIQAGGADVEAMELATRIRDITA